MPRSLRARSGPKYWMWKKIFETWKNKVWNQKIENLQLKNKTSKVKNENKYFLQNNSRTEIKMLFNPKILVTVLSGCLTLTYLVCDCRRFQAGRAQGHRWVWGRGSPGRTDPPRTGRGRTPGRAWPPDEAEQRAVKQTHTRDQEGSSLGDSSFTLFPQPWRHHETFSQHILLSSREETPPSLTVLLTYITINTRR